MKLARSETVQASLAIGWRSDPKIDMRFMMTTSCLPCIAGNINACCRRKLPPVVVPPVFFEHGLITHPNPDPRKVLLILYLQDQDIARFAWAVWTRDLQLPLKDVGRMRWLPESSTASASTMHKPRPEERGHAQQFCCRASCHAPFSPRCTARQEWQVLYERHIGPWQGRGR